MYDETTEFVVNMSDYKFLIIGFVILLAAIGLIAIYLRAYRTWKSLPTLEQYLIAHPDCRTNRGIKCSQCGSSSIKNWGVDHADDGRRKHICNHCNTTLYRSGIWVHI